MEEQVEIVEIERPVRRRIPVRPLWLLAALAAGILILVLVLLFGGKGRGSQARIAVVPVRGDMQSVVVVFREPVDVASAKLFLSDGEVDCSTLPGRRDVLLFFSEAAEQPERVEVMTKSGQVITITIRR